MTATRFYATDHDFFQVVRETKATVTVRPVKSEFVKYGNVSNQFDYEAVRRARANDFTTSFLLSDAQNLNGKRCKVNRDGSITLNAGWGVRAYPCDETETFEVFYG